LTRLYKSTRNINGSNNPNWKGGRYPDSNGYILIWKPDHVFVDKKGYVFEHRLVYEQYYNCILLPFTDIHHIDGNPKNNHISNLQPLYRTQHSKLENTKDTTNLFCFLCNKKTWKNKDNHEQWYKYQNNFICKKCFNKIYYQKKLRKVSYIGTCDMTHIAP